MALLVYGKSHSEFRVHFSFQFLQRYNFSWNFVAVHFSSDAIFNTFSCFIIRTFRSLKWILRTFLFSFTSAFRTFRKITNLCLFFFWRIFENSNEATILADIFLKVQEEIIVFFRLRLYLCITLYFKVENLLTDSIITDGGASAMEKWYIQKKHRLYKLQSKFNLNFIFEIISTLVSPHHFAMLWLLFLLQTHINVQKFDLLWLLLFDFDFESAAKFFSSCSLRSCSASSSLDFTSKYVFLFRSTINSGNGFVQSSGGCSRFFHTSLS